MPPGCTRGISAASNTRTTGGRDLRPSACRAFRCWKKADGPISCPAPLDAGTTKTAVQRPMRPQHLASISRTVRRSTNRFPHRCCSSISAAEAMRQSVAGCAFNVMHELRLPHEESGVLSWPAGTWSLSPAYDMTASRHPGPANGPAHQMLVNCQGAANHSCGSAARREAIRYLRLQIAFWDSGRGVLRRWPRYRALSRADGEITRIAGLRKSHDAIADRV